MTQIRESQPELAAAVNDPERFSEVFRAMEQQRAEADRQKQREIVCLGHGGRGSAYADFIFTSKCLMMIHLTSKPRQKSKSLSDKKPSWKTYRAR